MKSGWVRKVGTSEVHFTLEWGLRAPSVVCGIGRLHEIDRRDVAGQRCPDCVAWVKKARGEKETTA